MKRRNIFLFLMIPMGIGLFNIVINPFDQWAIPRFQTFNDKITETRWDALIKSYQITHRNYDTVILGSSRAAIALSPLHPSLQNHKVYNYGLSGAGIYFQYLALQKSLHSQPIKKIILTPDFFGFNAHLHLNQPVLHGHKKIERLFDASEKNTHVPPFVYTIEETLANTLGWRGVNSSLRTLISQKQKTVYIDQQGAWNRFGTKDKNFDEQYNRTERVFLTELLFPSPDKKFAFRDPETGYDSFVTFKQILTLAHQHAIDVHIVILPTPARDLLALQELHQWRNYQEWKKNLVRINEETAKEFMTKPYALWDFERGEDPVDSNNVIDQKPFYFEPFHPTALTGELVLNRVLMDCITVECWPGTRLSSDTIDASLARLDQDLMMYRSKYTQQVASMLKNIQKTDKYRNTQSNP